MVLSHRNHGNFSKKVTCFLNPNQKEKPKCQDFSEKKDFDWRRKKLTGGEKNTNLLSLS